MTHFDTPTAAAAVALRRLGDVVPGQPHRIGSAFEARHFSEAMFDGRMDPLLMVDHFVMTGPTFDPHPHAGISAVTLMFEDAEGVFLNRDTLGHRLDLKPGDLYWLSAARGAAHEEKPAPGARIHALQVFVNLPGRLKGDAPSALHVEAADVPELRADGHRVRVVLGRSGAVEGAGGTPRPVTMLDGFVDAGGRFPHALAAGQQAWIYAARGALTVEVEDESLALPEGSSTTLDAGPATSIRLTSREAAHFVLIAAEPIREAFVKHGPLVMSTAQQVREVLANYAAGRFGTIPS